MGHQNVFVCWPTAAAAMAFFSHTDTPASHPVLVTSIANTYDFMNIIRPRSLGHVSRIFDVYLLRDSLMLFLSCILLIQFVKVIYRFFSLPHTSF